MKRLPLFIILAGLSPQLAVAQVYISEIMYDPSGIDTGREWVEVCSDARASLAGWKLFENSTNHGLTEFRGGTEVAAGGCAVLADDPNKFLADYTAFDGIILDSSFSLKNTGEDIALKDGALNIADSVAYDANLGASEDGNSLQKINGAWVAASPTPGAIGAITVAQEPVAPGSSVAQDSGNVSGGAASIPTITAYAGGDKAAVAGAAIILKGEAYGLKNEPIDNARFFWSFGDGAVADGRMASHVYALPGIYQAVLSVVSGQYSASDYIKISVEPNTLYISEAKTGEGSWLEINNSSNAALDIAGWSLVSGNQKFIFPENTLILSKSWVGFSAQVTGLRLEAGSGTIYLLYPDGKIADTFVYSGMLGIGQSFNKTDSQTVVLTASPGAAPKNIPTANDKSAVASVPLRISSPDSAEEDVQIFDSPIQKSEAAKANVIAGAGGSGQWSVWVWLALSLIVGASGAVAFLLNRRGQ